MSTAVFRPLVSDVYGRLATGTLQPDDVVTLDDIKVESAPQWLRGAYDENRIIEEDATVFGRFRKEMGAILDVGAHWGYTALSMRRAGTDCPIVSFEALQAHLPCLEEFKKLDDGGYDYLITAVSDSTKTVVLYGPVVNGEAVTGLNSVNGAIFQEDHMEYLTSLVGTVIPLAGSYNFQLLEVKLTARALDEILVRTKFEIPTDKIAGIKITVEGHEGAVLRGAVGTINRDLPFIVTSGGNRNPEIRGIMRDYGYSYARRDGDRIVPSEAFASDYRGYWFHNTRRDEYRAMGFLS